MSRRLSLDRLIDRVTETLRQYLEQGSTRTDLLVAAAKDIAELRSRFTVYGTRPDSDRQVAGPHPDWSGRSPGYRAAMKQIYDRLGVSGKPRDTLQFAVRYHVGNELRQRASADELEEAGLPTTSPRDRILLRQGVQAATAAAVGVTKGAHEDLPRVMAWASVLLEYAETVPGELTDEESAAVLALVGDCRASLSVIKGRVT